MLLLACDMNKALWYLISSTATIAWGPLTGQSKFCQASGFMMLYTVEACGESAIPGQCAPIRLTLSS